VAGGWTAGEPYVGARDSAAAFAWTVVVLAPIPDPCRAEPDADGPAVRPRPPGGSRMTTDKARAKTHGPAGTYEPSRARGQAHRLGAGDGQRERGVMDSAVVNGSSWCFVRVHTEYSTWMRNAKVWSGRYGPSRVIKKNGGSRPDSGEVVVNVQ